MTINPSAWILLAMYIALAQKRGSICNKLSGTIQADILKEYIAQKEWIFPIDADGAHRARLHHLLRASTWRATTRSTSSGYHISEAGASPLQEAAFTLATCIAYVEEVQQDRDARR